MTDMKIVAYRLYPNDSRVRISAGERDRRWMDETQDSYAYRCLPLNIANQHGWAVYPASEISAIWTGGPRIEDIDIFHSGQGIAASAFGSLAFASMAVRSLRMKSTSKSDLDRQ